MASLTANGGATYLLNRGETRAAVCANGKVLQNYGAGWKTWVANKSKLPVDELRDRLVAKGWVVEETAAANRILTKSQADAAARQRLREWDRARRAERRA